MLLETRLPKYNAKVGGDCLLIGPACGRLPSQDRNESPFRRMARLMLYSFFGHSAVSFLFPPDDAMEHPEQGELSRVIKTEHP